MILAFDGATLHVVAIPRTCGGDPLIAIQTVILLNRMDRQLEIEDEFYENENHDSIPVCDEDITEYILENYVLSDAMDYTNKRIRKYFELI